MIAKCRPYAPLFLVLVLLVAAAATYGVVSSQSGNGKYDRDGDGLIEVTHLEQLDAIRYDPNGDGDSGFEKYYEAFPILPEESVCDNACHGYELVRSLDFNEPESYASGEVRAEWVTGSGWQSIGKSEEIGSGFHATFEGNHNTIGNLYINRKREEYGGSIDGAAGLFSTTFSGSIIRRVGMIGVDITAEAPAGGLAGHNAGLVESCYATGAITATGWASSDGGGFSIFSAGGLVGINDGTVKYSHASANVSGDVNVGGLVGYNSDSNGAIIASYSSGRVSDRNSDAYFGEFGRAIGNSIGGLVGDNSGTVNSSYSVADVSGDDNVGGLVGFAFSDSLVSDSYATGDVRGHDSVGGLVGNNNATIRHSYAAGMISGDSWVGGLVGSSWNQEPRVEFSYWEIHSSGMEGVSPDSSDLIDRFGEGKTTAGLQNPTSNTGIYSEWSPDIWDFGTSQQYPVLKADVDGDGIAHWWELGPQFGDPPTRIPTATATPEGPWDCIQGISDGVVIGSWASGCESEARSGSNARYYIFDLVEESEVAITLESSDADAYLYLWQGEERSGASLNDHAADDDAGEGTDSETQETLAVGSYTIEATTYYKGEVGEFILTVSGLGAGPPHPCIVGKTLSPGDRCGLHNFTLEVDESGELLVRFPGHTADLDNFALVREGDGWTIKKLP